MKKSRLEDVICTANQIMRTDGYTNLSFSKIAKELNVTRENIHHYYKKKELLGIDCLEFLTRDLDKKLNQLVKLEINAEEKLLRYFENYKWRKEDLEDCPIASFLSEYHLLPKSMQEKVTVLSEVELNYLEMILNQGVQEGSLVFKRSSKLEAMMIISQLKGAVGYSKIYNNFKQISEEIVKQLKPKA